MSASSQSSRRSFRATRKQPLAEVANGAGPSDKQVSKFRPSGEKFAKIAGTGSGAGAGAGNDAGHTQSGFN